MVPSSTMPPSSDSALIRSIGTLALAAGIVNVTIGGGIFRLPADMAAQLGAMAPVAYLLCAVVMGLIVLCLAEAGSRVSLTGGPYAYVEIAFGPLAGFLAGFLLWMLSTFAMAAVATVLVANLGALVPALASRVVDFRGARRIDQHEPEIASARFQAGDDLRRRRMLDRDDIGDAETRRQRARNADRKAARLAGRRILGVLERGEDANPDGTHARQIGDLRVGA